MPTKYELIFVLVVAFSSATVYREFTLGQSAWQKMLNGEFDLGNFTSNFDFDQIRNLTEQISANFLPLLDDDDSDEDDDSMDNNVRSSITIDSFSSPTATSTASKSKKGRIAILSGFVTSRAGYNQGIKKMPRISEKIMPHMLNKQCYARLWDYDYIFNTTWGFDDLSNSDNPQRQHQRHWLEYGTWHRVPHMMAAMDQGYDWVLYADTDYVFQDMTVPLEAFVKELELHGNKNVSVIVPKDLNREKIYTFSAFTVFIKNDAFGRRVLENWMEFANGICPNGNFAKSIPGKYHWTDSDQPGLWYGALCMPGAGQDGRRMVALNGGTSFLKILTHVPRLCEIFTTALPKTHDEFFRIPESGVKYEAKCNNATGHITTRRYMGPEMNDYFESYQNRIVRGTHGHALVKMHDGESVHKLGRVWVCFILYLTK